MDNAPERRELSFANLDEVLTEVERLVAQEVRTTGNHDFGQILNHLTLSQDVTSGQAEAPPAPFFMKLMTPLLRRMVINDKPLKPGVKLPSSGESFFWPNQSFDIQDAFQAFKESVKSYQLNGPLPRHPFFGKLTPQESEQLQCRHAALHLSFVHPVSNA